MNTRSLIWLRAIGVPAESFRRGRFLRQMGSVALMLALCLVGALQADASDQVVTREIEWSKSLNLEEFGAPHIELAIRAREMTFISAQTADYTQMVATAYTNIQGVAVDNFSNTATVYGNTGTDLQPTKRTVNVKREHGIPGPDGRHEMYLLYQEPKTGIRIYFLDVISRQNFDTLVIAVPKPVVSPSASQVAPQAVPQATNSIAAKNTDSTPISPELFAWYVRLQKERESLDTTNPTAVAAFNSHVATYHAALKAAREAQQREPQ